MSAAVSSQHAAAAAEMALPVVACTGRPCGAPPMMLASAEGAAVVAAAEVGDSWHV